MAETTPPKLSHVTLSDSHAALVTNAKALYQDRLAYFAQTHSPPAYICAAPGRVNLIGEHTDYQDGFVLPFALAEYAVVVYGTGFLNTGKSSAATTIRIRLVSDQANVPEMIEERHLSGTFRPPAADQKSWVDYVVGVLVQYMPDIPSEGCVLDLAMAYSSNLPLGAGLSSSAALEVATAVFVESFLHDGMAFSGCQESAKYDHTTTRALRCQTAEHTWAHSPCGIMDQYVVAAARANHLLSLDCRTLKATHVPTSEEDDKSIAMLICNSGVSHAIADGEYGKRRKECSDAVQALQAVPLYHVESLRDATQADVLQGQSSGKLDDVLVRRARHVVSENTRTKECQTAWQMGLWDKVGELMNTSHASLKEDFEVSCDELDVLVDIAQAQEGVYGSRMTGGGFGGCTVTLVQQSQVESVMEAMQTQYKEKTGKDCQCFVAHPGDGAKVLAIDMDCKPESDFYK